jgi:hypothetical protein
VNKKENAVAQLRDFCTTAFRLAVALQPVSEDVSELVGENNESVLDVHKAALV